MSTDPTTIPAEAPEDAREAFPHGVARAPSSPPAPVHPLHALCLTLAGEAIGAQLSYQHGAHSGDPHHGQRYEALRSASAVRDAVVDAYCYCSAVIHRSEPSGPVAVEAISVATLAYLRECLPADAASIVFSAREAIRRAEEAISMGAGVASASVVASDAPAVVAPPTPATRAVVLHCVTELGAPYQVTLTVPATDEATYSVSADGRYLIPTTPPPPEKTPSPISLTVAMDREPSDPRATGFSDASAGGATCSCPDRIASAIVTRALDGRWWMLAHVLRSWTEARGEASTIDRDGYDYAVNVTVTHCPFCGRALPEDGDAGRGDVPSATSGTGGGGGATMSVGDHRGGGGGELSTQPLLVELLGAGTGGGAARGVAGKGGSGHGIPGEGGWATPTGPSTSSSVMGGGGGGAGSGSVS